MEQNRKPRDKSTSSFLLSVRSHIYVIAYDTHPNLIFFLVLYFLINLLFYWRIIALQNFAVFCQTSTWISYRYTYIPPFWTSLPSPPHPIPLEADTEPLFGFPETYRKFPLAIYFTYGNVSFHVTLSVHLTIFPFPMSISLFSLSLFYFFHWRISAVQNFVVFCQTSTWISHAAAAAAKSRQSCPTLCNP